MELLLEHGVQQDRSADIGASRNHEAIRKSLGTILGQDIPEAESSRSAEVRGEFKNLLSKLIQLYELREDKKTNEKRETFKRLVQEIGERLVEVEKLNGKRFDKTSDYLAFIVAANEDSEQPRLAADDDDSLNNKPSTATTEKPLTFLECLSKSIASLFH